MVKMEIYNCPGFQAGVSIGLKFGALAHTGNILVAKAESLMLTIPWLKPGAIESFPPPVLPSFLGKCPLQLLRPL